MTWGEHISSDPHVCHGRVCIKGTRVMVSVVLDSLAAGESPDEIAQAFHITREDIDAAILYAAQVVRERIVPLSSGAA